jgi:glutamate/tyrosine decarboxylase-like PLP-dependent enzyme
LDHRPVGAFAVIRQMAGEWIKELFDLPRMASFAFTTGCQLAHMTGLAAARHALLKRTAGMSRSMGA